MARWSVYRFEDTEEVVELLNGSRFTGVRRVLVTTVEAEGPFQAARLCPPPSGEGYLITLEGYYD